MPNGRSKLRHMKRAKSSSSSSSEASDSPSRQRQSDGRHASHFRSANSSDQIESANPPGKVGQRLPIDTTSLGEDQSSGELGYEAGDDAKSAARPEESVQGGRDADTGGDIQEPAESDMRRTVQGSQLPTSNRSSDHDGNVDVDGIRDDDFRDLGLELLQPSSRTESHTRPGHDQSGTITGSAVSTKRGREDDEDDGDQHGPKGKWARVEGA